MRRRTNSGLITTLVFSIIASGLWLHQRSRARTALEELHNVQRERERASLAVAALQRDLDAVHTVMQKLKRELATTTVQSPQAGAVPQPPKTGSLDIRQLFVEHPEWRPIYEASEKTAFLNRYAAFIASVGLSPERREQFARELMRHDENKAEARTMAQRHSWPPDDPRLVALQREEQDRHATELASLLGEAGLRQLQQFESNLPVRPFVEELVERLYHTEQPISSVVAEQLTQSLARHAVNTQGKIERGALDWDAALAESAAVLTPDQLVQLQRIRETTELGNKMNQIVRRAARGR